MEYFLGKKPINWWKSQGKNVFTFCSSLQCFIIKMITPFPHSFSALQLSQIILNPSQIHIFFSLLLYTHVYVLPIIQGAHPWQRLFYLLSEFVNCTLLEEKITFWAKSHSFSVHRNMVFSKKQYMYYGFWKTNRNQAKMFLPLNPRESLICSWGSFQEAMVLWMLYPLPSCPLFTTGKEVYITTSKRNSLRDLHLFSLVKLRQGSFMDTALSDCKIRILDVHL